MTAYKLFEHTCYNLTNHISAISAQNFLL